MTALASVLITIAAVGAACSTNANQKRIPDPVPTAEKTQTGGEIVVALEEEPASLNPWTIVGAATPATTTIVGPVLSQLLAYTPNYGYEPMLLTKLPTLISQNPQKVRYEIRPEATWNDGTPITAADVQFTLDQILAPASNVVSRDGYTQIKGAKLTEVSADGKAFTLEFTGPYGPWLDLFASSAQPILQAVKMQGVDFNSAFQDGIPFASGPFKLETWTKSSAITLVRNDAYWGKTKAFLDRITFRFAQTEDLQIKAIRSGEVNAISQVRQPDIAVGLREVPNINVEVTAGPLWEHLDFNLSDELLGLAEVRQAIGFAIDRGEIVNTVAKPINPETVVLDNVFYVPAQAQYEPNWNTYHRDLTKVGQLLTKAGFAKGAAGIWAKGDRKLALTLITTKGNALRKRTADILRRQLAEAGIELTVEELDVATLRDRLPNCEYQIALFAYRGSPDPSWANRLYRDDERTCKGDEQNVAGRNSLAYRNVEVGELLRAADAEPDQRRRAQIYNTADELIARDIPTLPLYQNSTVLAFDSRYHNLIDNPTIEGPTWNASTWWLKQSKKTTTTSRATAPTTGPSSSTTLPATTAPAR